MTSTLRFFSFGRPCSGRLVTSAAGLAVVNARNPYGTHNLVLVDEESRESIRPGNAAVVGAAAAWMPRRAYRRVRRFLAERGEYVSTSTHGPHGRGPGTPRRIVNRRKVRHR